MGYLVGSGLTHRFQAPEGDWGEWLITVTNHAVHRFATRVGRPRDVDVVQAIASALRVCVVTTRAPEWWAADVGGRQPACGFLVAPDGEFAFPLVKTPGGVIATTCVRRPYVPQEQAA